MSPAARNIVEHIRQTLDAIDTLEPHEADLIIGAIVADLRSRRPVAVSPLGVLPPPGEPIRDPRGAR
jgi:hypothetical protein